jgi:ABC-type polar amino acid transport system ATPase subunit
VKLIELTDYSLNPFGNGRGIYRFDFSLSEGDVCCINAGEDDGQLFLRALATLEAPLQGVYRYRGEALDFSDYRHLLPIKRKIGYISSDLALISNRTLLDNLLLLKTYFEDTLSEELPDDMAELCRHFQLMNKLHLRPAQVSQGDRRIAAAIRELGKKPEVILLERPRDFMGYRIFELFKKILTDIVHGGTPIAFQSADEEFIRDIANREVRIAEGKLESSPFSPGTFNDKTPVMK